ncbi:MAG: hypothetical protein FWH52_00895 [Synergistaceae bacterium]|nr:hypothetical protein [Synergistaceae bacterium]
MRNRNSIISIGIIGAIILAFTLSSFFLLNIERIAVNFWALTFLLFSECVLFGGLIGLRFHGVQQNKVFLKAGITTALSLYFSITLVSVFFAGLLKERLNTFFLIELAIIALFSIAIMVILAFSREVKHSNEADIAKVGNKESKRGGF